MNRIMTIRIFALLALFLVNLQSCKKDTGFHQITAIEKQIHDRINDYRKDNGLNSLVLQPILFLEARAHSLRMVNGVIEPGYAGLDDVFQDLNSKLGSGSSGAVISLTELSIASSIVELFQENASMDSVLLGTFTQSGVGFATDKDALNYITVLFLDIP